jgi:hypothetical protein
LAATDSVAWLSSAASGMMAHTESRNSSVCASALSFSAASTTGKKASSQSSGLWRISASSCFMALFGTRAVCANGITCGAVAPVLPEVV